MTPEKKSQSHHRHAVVVNRLAILTLGLPAPPALHQRQGCGSIEAKKECGALVDDVDDVEAEGNANVKHAQVLQLSILTAALSRRSN